MSGLSYRLGLHLSGDGGQSVLVSPDREVMGTRQVDGWADPVEAVDALLRLVVDDLLVEGASALRLKVIVGIDAIDGLLPPNSPRRVGMICTEGFRDSLEIGHGPLGDAWAIRRPPPPALVPRALRRTVRERIDHHGKILQPIERASLRRAIEDLRQAEVHAIAVCLMHACAEPRHERQVAEAISEFWPEADTYLSSEILPMVGEYERATTTALAAFVTPAFQGLVDALDRFAGQVGGSVTYSFLQANGGLTAERDRRAAARVMLAGGASRVAAAAALAARRDMVDLVFVSLDEAETSIVALPGGVPEMSGTLIHAGYPSFLPALDVTRIAVGSRSRAWITSEGGAMLEGPPRKSVPRDPQGPTLEDSVAALGRRGDQATVTRTKAARPMSALSASLACDDTESAAIVVEAAAVRIASAVRMVSVEKAVALAEAEVLLAGTIAPAVAPRVAAILRRPVLVAAETQLGPAANLLLAPYRVDLAGQLSDTLEDLDLAEVRERLRALDGRAREALPEVETILACRLHARYRGESQSLALTVDPSLDVTTSRLVEMFHELHRSHFAHAEPDEVIEVTGLSVTLSSGSPEPVEPRGGSDMVAVPSDEGQPTSSSRMRSDAWSLLHRDAFESQVESITMLMDWLMARTARSSIFREAHDYSCFVTSAQGEVLGQSSGLPIHTGSGAFAVRRLLQYWGGDGEISGDDIFILNDPYFSGGAHLPDWTVIAPVMVDGRIVGFACNRSHQLDVGGGALGSQNSDAREIYHEGVRLPPMRLIERGALRRDLFDLLAINTRYPERIADDVRAMIGSVVRGRDALRDLAGHLSPSGFEAAAAAVLDGAEARARTAILAIPDGVYHAVEAMNNDCWSETPVPIELTLTVAGSGIIADFSGSADQIPAFKNSPLSNTFSAVCVGIGTLLPEDVPHNSGTFRSIRVTAPQGSVVNATAPAPVGVGTCYPAWDIAHVVWRALADVVPDIVPAGWGKTSAPVSVGSHGPGRPYVLYHWGAQPGSGAMKGLDGRNVSGDLPALGGFMWPSLEAMEQQFPVRFVRQEFRTDAAGAGEFRGGSGLDYMVEHLEPMVYNLRGEGDRTPSGFGMAGGNTGAKAQSRLLLPEDTEWLTLPQYAIIEVPAGSRYWLLSSGGGGWGPPTRRDPERVLADVQDGLVSPDVARDVYGAGPLAGAEASQEASGGV